MSIDKGWRGFLNGQNHIVLVKIIQEVTNNFVHDMRREGIITEDIHLTREYQNALITRDLSKVKALFHLDIEFEFGKAKLINFFYKFSRNVPRLFNQLKDIDDPNWVKMNKHMEFFRSANSLVDIRNTDAHVKTPINGSGWSLLAAGHVMTLVELMPQIKDTSDFKALQDSLIFLLDAIKEVENDAEQEEESEQEGNQEQKEKEYQKNKLTESEITNNLIDKMSYIMETKFDLGLNEFNQKVSDIPESIKDYIDKKFDELPLHKQINSKESDFEETDSWDINNSAHSINIPENVIILSEDQATDLNETSVKDEEKLIESSSREYYEEQEMSKTESRKFLTPSEADREMLMLQKRIKKETRCENWENLAQGPIRKEILNNKICRLEDFMENHLIYEKYNKHKDIMLAQIESEAGTEFFSILERITWN